MKKQRKVALLTPLTGNGGIASWSRKYLSQFRSEKFLLVPVNRASPESAAYHNTRWQRMAVGVRMLLTALRSLRKMVSSEDISIIHATTSGSLGTLRDLMVTLPRYRRNSKTILQNHYGCIPEEMQRQTFGHLLRWVMGRYDEIWVLDTRTEQCLKSYKSLKDKVVLVPNCIEVKPLSEIPPKTYRHFAFIANLIPEKGLFELVEAFAWRTDDAVLSIVGGGSLEVERRLKEKVGAKIGKTIFLKGPMSNDKALEFMSSVDVVALPTYMPQEAFPISILEAMSLGKLVISTKRAAIGDMLTMNDGSPCGLFVGERSVDDLCAAIDYCRQHPTEADELCRKAYRKVCDTYSTEVVYRMYEQRYAALLEN